VLAFPPHGQADFSLLCLYIGVTSALGTPLMVFPMAMLNDVADYDALRSGTNRNGTYYAFRLIGLKASFAAGNALGFYTLSLVGYDPKAAAHSAFATWGMLIALTAAPGLLFVGAGLFLLPYPLDERRHALIRRALARRTAGRSLEQGAGQGAVRWMGPIEGG
jgi:Na+/melibiose symporter-like transporter